MSLGKRLSDYEKGRIDEMVSNGISSRAIARALSKDGVPRGHNVVCNYLRDRNGYGQGRKRGPKRKLTVRDERRLLRAASNSPMSAANLKLSLNLPISASKTRAYLNQSISLRHMKVKHSPSLSTQHKERRLRWARKHVMWDRSRWGLVVFSDEKRFNLDGPDGFNFYWHDLRKGDVVLSRRQNGGGGIMVWGAFSLHGRSELAILEGRQNTSCYLRVIEEYLLPFTDEKMPISWTYQQDNAPVHVSPAALSWFSTNGIHLMQWPSRSPDSTLWKMYGDGSPVLCMRTIGSLQPYRI